MIMIKMIIPYIDSYHHLLYERGKREITSREEDV